MKIHHHCLSKDNIFLSVVVLYGDSNEPTNIYKVRSTSMRYFKVQRLEQPSNPL